MFALYFIRWRRISVSNIFQLAILPLVLCQYYFRRLLTDRSVRCSAVQYETYIATYLGLYEVYMTRTMKHERAVTRYAFVYRMQVIAINRRTNVSHSVQDLPGHFATMEHQLYIYIYIYKWWAVGDWCTATTWDGLIVCGLLLFFPAFLLEWWHVHCRVHVSHLWSQPATWRFTRRTIVTSHRHTTARCL